MIEAAHAEAIRENARRDAEALRAALPALRSAWEEADMWGSARTFEAADRALDRAFARLAELDRVAR